MRLHVKRTTDEDKPAHLECMWQLLLFKELHSNGVNLGKINKIYAKKFYWRTHRTQLHLFIAPLYFGILFYKCNQFIVKRSVQL